MAEGKPLAKYAICVKVGVGQGGWMDVLRLLPLVHWARRARCHVSTRHPDIEQALDPNPYSAHGCQYIWPHQSLWVFQPWTRWTQRRPPSAIQTHGPLAPRPDPVVEK